MTTFGPRLAQEAIRREVSHQDAADLIGVSQATFSRWVNGDNLPSSAYFTKIARFLRTNRDELAAVVAAEKIARAITPRTESRIATVEAELDGLRDDIHELRELILSALKLPGRQR